MKRIRIASALVALTICSSAVISVAAAGPVKKETTYPQPIATTATAKHSLKDMDPDDSKITITLNKEDVKKETGKKFRLKAQLNRAGYETEFYSTDKSVAVVNENGVVKTKKPGKVNIVAKCNGVKKVCKVKVVKPAGNSIKDSTMKNIVAKVGKQTDYVYPSSSVMCSAYSFAYAYLQVTGKYITPGSVWSSAGCTWTGGTYRRYSSAEEMLSTIKNEIDNNRACVGLLSGNSGTHYVTFYSYTGDGTTLSDYTVMDPWDGAIRNAAALGYNSYHVVTID